MSWRRRLRSACRWLVGSSSSLAARRRSHGPVRLRLEPLESRQLLHGGDIEILPDRIVAPGGNPGSLDVIPRFAANPTIWTVASGDWDNPLTWSAGRVPSAVDRVAIRPQFTVTLGAGHDAGAVADSIEIQDRAALVFSADANTRLSVANVLVLPTGRLQIGTAAKPVAASKRAELIIVNKPIDAGYQDATGLHAGSDPRQFGTGLIVYGTLDVHGANPGPTWVELAAPARRGETAIELATAVPWRAGDHLVLPDTRQWQYVSGQPGPGVAGQWEEVVISSVAGNRVVLAAPLAFEHLGAATTLLDPGELLPHAALLTRNVIVRSDDSALLPGGTRGHVLFGARAEIGVFYAQFANLGRTDAISAGPDPLSSQAIDNTRFNVDGTLAHIGTNQIGRYAVHFHHLIGPENPANVGYQFQFVGNTIQGSKKWALALHGTSFGLVSGNVIYDGQGAGIVTEDGTEIGNVIADNIVIAMRGTGVDGNHGLFDQSVPGAPLNDFARGGSGFWFRRSGNAVTGNVVADCTFAGYVFNSYFLLGQVLVPRARGTSKLDDGEGLWVRNNDPGTFADNEVYGLTDFGLSMAYPTGSNVDPNGSPQTLASFTVSDFRAWHASTVSGIFVYHVSNTLLDRPIVVADLAAWRRPDAGPVGIYLGHDYECYDVVVRDAVVEGHRVGLVAPRADYSRFDGDRLAWTHPTLIENGTFQNYFNVLVQPQLQYTTALGNVLELRNVALAAAAYRGVGVPLNSADVPSGPLNIEMNLAATDANVTHHSLVRVFDYNRQPGDDFQVLYAEQSPDALVPATDPQALVSTGAQAVTIGAPESGLTNELAWAKYGIAVGGQPAAGPVGTRPGIVGLVTPLDPPVPATSHLIAWLTPWDGAVLAGTTEVRVRYNVNLPLPSGYDLWLQLDDGAPINARDFTGAFWYVANGRHLLTGWITDALGSQVTAETASFLVLPAADPAARYVTSAKDDGPGSLRQAIRDVNASGGAVHRIVLYAPGDMQIWSPLPEIRYPVILEVPREIDVRIGMLGPLAGFPQFVGLTKLGGGSLQLRGTAAVDREAAIAVGQGSLGLWYEGGPRLAVSVGGLGLPAELAMQVSARLASLTLQPGGTAVLASASPRQLLDVAALAVQPGATLDLRYGQLIVRGDAQTAAAVYATVLANIESAVRAPGGRWQGGGVTSSVAAFDGSGLSSLGIMSNDDGLAGAYWTEFAGASVGRFDTLVRWTYVGDADLSGAIDGTDFALLDNGFNNGAAGWFSGDFDYSGAVDGTDFALIDNAFNYTSSPFARRLWRLR